MQVYIVNRIGEPVCIRCFLEICSYFQVYPVIRAYDPFFFQAAVKSIQAYIIKSNLSQNGKFLQN